jgi:DNA end-binding protein Ku
VGEKAYSLLQSVMAERGQSALGQVVLARREQLVLVRPLGRLLVMTVLSHAGEVREPAAFEAELGAGKPSRAEVELARKLIDEATLETFDLSGYPSGYTERLRKLIELKLEGREIVRAPAPEEPQVVELMEALRASVARAEKSQARTPAERKASKKSAPSARKRRTGSRGRKTG